jgi:hypothetical protein
VQRRSGLKRPLNAALLQPTNGKYTMNERDQMRADRKARERDAIDGAKKMWDDLTYDYSGKEYHIIWPIVLVGGCILLAMVLG